MYHLKDFISKSANAESFTKDELVAMLAYPSDSPEIFALMTEARRISKELTGDRAEVHAQFSVNLAPCPVNCMFCSFAVANGCFTQSSEVSIEDTVWYAQKLEADAANAVYMMTTANYDFGRFIEFAQEVRKNLKPETVMIANIGDRSYDEARTMKDAGFTGVYHAVRMREGIDTSIEPEVRMQSIAAFKEVGLAVGTCVEPVGPEHTDEEIAERILLTAGMDPAYSGAARRIAIPGSEMAKLGMISELRMAHIVAVTRLGMPRTVKGNCTHEPCTLGTLAGANLLWAEVGANPRDTREKTEEGRGFTVSRCRDIFNETECGVLDGPSVYYRETSARLKANK